MIDFIKEEGKLYLLMMLFINIFCQFFIWFAYLLGADYCKVLAWSIIGLHGLTWFMTLVVIVGLGLYVLFDKIKDRLES